ncbi:MAG: hypothetical protein Tsb009_35290 [Planctomycetaceae bacterium]
MDVERFFQFLSSDYGYDEPRASEYNDEYEITYLCHDSNMQIKIYSAGFGAGISILFCKMKNGKTTVSRDLDYIIQMRCPDQFGWPLRIPNGWPQSSEFTNTDIRRKVLELYSKIIKKHCDDLVSGDFSNIEELVTDALPKEEW